jgi:hypothetical protein
MRYVVSGRLRTPCPLSPARYFTLAIREWEMVLGWLASGRALAYGRLGTPAGGALLLEVASEAEALALVESLPFAAYAEVTVRRSDLTPVIGAAGVGSRPASAGG